MWKQAIRIEMSPYRVDVSLEQLPSRHTYGSNTLSIAIIYYSGKITLVAIAMQKQSSLGRKKQKLQSSILLPFRVRVPVKEVVVVQVNNKYSY